MKINKIIYWIATAVMCIIFLFSATMYLTKYAMVEGFFQQLGFPTWIIYPLATAKILGVIAVLSKLSPFLKELAYAGFLFDATMAFTAHYMADDGAGMMASIAFVATAISWIFDRKAYPRIA